MKSFVKTIPKKLHRGFNHLIGKSPCGAVILLYHRVADLHPDIQLLCVTPTNFEDHLKILCEYYHPISLHDLKHHLISKTLPRNAVVITFDDGYVDNLVNAAPLLEKYGVPATIFVTTGFVNHSDEMVSDTLERILLSLEKLPETLTLKIGGKTHQWFLGENFQQFNTWNITSKNDPSSRYLCYRDLHRMLRPMSAYQRQEVLKKLYDWAGLEGEGRPDRRIMNSEEIGAISRSGLIEIGAHSMSHTMLAKQVLEVQQQEILGSKEELETILGSPITSFSYPYGGADAVDIQTVRLVQNAGFDLACDNVPGTVGPASELYTLPRFLVRDWNRDEFEKRMKNTFL